MKEFVGSYNFGEFTHTDGTKTFSFSMSLYKKPSFIKRFFMKHLLGFVWKDKTP